MLKLGTKQTATAERSCLTQAAARPYGREYGCTALARGRLERVSQAIESTFPQAVVQPCVVHLVRSNR